VQTFDVLIIRTVTGAGTDYSDHVVNYNDFGDSLKKPALTFKSDKFCKLVLLLISTYQSKIIPCYVGPCHSVLSLRMEERPTVCKVVVNIFSKQSRTADKGWFSGLGVGRSAINSSP